MHTSHNIKVIIETESIPIIEKCKDIKFARYSSTTNKEEIIKLEIQDFDAPNNLSEQVQNWTLLDREEYDGIQAIIGTVNLKDTIEDLTSGNIDETLKKLGI